MVLFLNSRYIAFFGKEEYAHAFANGHIRLGWLRKKYDKKREVLLFGWLKKFGKTADVREDHTEGEFLYITGQFQLSGISINEHYIICSSNVTESDEIKLLRQRFAAKRLWPILPRYAKIFNARKFTEKVAAALENAGYADIIMGLKWYEVEYTKGTFISASGPKEDLEIYQKPAEHRTHTFVRKKWPKKKVVYPPGLSFNKANFPPSVWEEIVATKDFTCEKEWRLVAIIRPKAQFTEQQLNRIQVQGEQRKKRVEQYNDISRDDFDSIPGGYESLEADTLLWLNDIVVECPVGLEDCVEICR